MQHTVSGLILTYNPDYRKLIATIRSLMWQEGIDIQIVVADDGSREDHFERLRAFFLQVKFTNFVLVKNENNCGTVKNYISGLNACNGEYVKAISPGDYISGPDIIRNWISFMEQNDLCSSGSDYYCYKFDSDKNIQSVRMRLHPKFIVGEKYQVINYLLNDDIFCGATFLDKTERLKAYVGLLQDRVIYAEDNVKRIMFYSGEKMGFYKGITTIYEVGDGISTSNSQMWNQRLQKDWMSTNKIILSLNTPYDKLRDDFIKVSKLREDSTTTKNRLLTYLKIKHLPILKLRALLSRRYSKETIPSQWTKQLFA